MKWELLAQKSLQLVGGTRVTQLISVKDRAGDEIRQQVLEVEITPVKLTTTKYDVIDSIEPLPRQVSTFNFEDVSVIATPRGNPRITDGII